MERRASIKRISSFLGLAVYFPSLTGILEGCSERKGPVWAPLQLQKQQRDLIGAFADQIIPPTDTPGAVDVSVPNFIETLLRDVFRVQDARDMLDDLEQFNKDCQAVSENEFLKCTTEQRKIWMKEVAHTSHHNHAIFMKMRELVVGAYFTSEAGMKQSLNYVPIPKKFEVCLKTVGHNKIMVGDQL